MAPPRTIADLDMAAPCDVGCGPHVHTGPHWLHMDRRDRAEHRRLLRLAVETKNVSLAHYVAEAELRRLAAKEREMRARGFWTEEQEA